ncbi:ATPase, T2SS/T4P/T4SS family [Granulosicoccaceae sp. 1_MG-2023]|nr:ATPase, T2SS/T4P/T4SS family [Granulosicoccaceae sp. 1_MG-2023]
MNAQTDHASAIARPGQTSSAALDLTSLAAPLAAGVEANSLKLTHRALMTAVKCGAGSVFIEPEDGLTRLRFRIGRQLREEIVYADEALFEAGTVLRTLSGNSRTADSAGPEQVSILIDSDIHDIQLAPLQTRQGEALTLHIQKRLRYAPTLDELGMSPPTLRRLREISREQNGLILLAGDCRHSLQLLNYAMLQDLNCPDLRIISIEERVRLPLPRVAQLTLPSSRAAREDLLSSLHLQDPDIVSLQLINERRFFAGLLETAAGNRRMLAGVEARTATRALHRLRSLQLRLADLAPLLGGIVSSQQLRTICPHCKHVHHPLEKESHWIRENFPGARTEKLVFAEGEGCDACAWTGLGPARSLYDVVEIDQEMRAAIACDDMQAFNTALALHPGFQSLREKAFKLACKGEVSLAQAMTVV